MSADLVEYVRKSLRAAMRELDGHSNTGTGYVNRIHGAKREISALLSRLETEQ